MNQYIYNMPTIHIRPMLVPRSIGPTCSPAKTRYEPMLVQCWPAICDVCPTLTQQWFNVSRLLRVHSVIWLSQYPHLPRSSKSTGVEVLSGDVTSNVSVSVGRMCMAGTCNCDFPSWISKMRTCKGERPKWRRWRWANVSLLLGMCRRQWPVNKTTLC